MKSLIAASAAAVTLLCLNGSTEAGHPHHGGHTHYTPGVTTGGYIYSSTRYYPTAVPVHQYRRPRVTWHDTTHIDVTPARLVVSPNGLQYIPSRRVLHVDGHYDVHHEGHHHRTRYPLRQNTSVIYYP